MMKLDFEEIALGKQNEYEKLFQLCEEKTSDYSFVNLWGWAEEYRLSWAWHENLVWIRQEKPQVRFWAPVGRWNDGAWDKYLEVFFHGSAGFDRVPQALVKIWEQNPGLHMEAEEQRDQWDYLYQVEDLVGLSGNRYHKKKNLLNQFKKKYDYEFIRFNQEPLEAVLSMQEDWCTWRDCESSEILAAENRVILKVLEEWKNIKKLMGGALLVDRKMVAYTIAEELSENMLLIHFEKGTPEYKGVYQAINQMFLYHSGNSYDLVNREQDLGNEGLRKAKMSYLPKDFLKKYRVTLTTP